MESVEQLVEATRRILAQRAITEFERPVELASGNMSKHFVDAKAGLSRADDLRVACLTLNAVVRSDGIEFDSVGGLTLGADHLCVGIALATGTEWFIVRKEAKKRGTGRQIEGATLGTGSRVLVVEDVVSTGGSLFRAIDVIEATGAQVVAATTLIDRGDVAAPILRARNIPYFPVTSFRDFGMPPVLDA